MQLSARTFKNTPSILIAFLMVIPIYYLLLSAVNVEYGVWARLWSHRVPALLVNSLLLVGTVTFLTLLLGSTLAFLVEKTNLPFRRVFRPLLITPLIIPCYIVAICYINFFGIKGLGEKLLSSIGIKVHLPNIYGFWGAAILLTIGAYPYVYTIVASALSRMDPTFSEVARSLGANRLKRFISITMPLLIPALSAGAVLVSLYVLSDFGVVSLLRYSTFVNTIYEQISGRYDYSAAISLSTILLVLTFGLFVFQETLIEGKQYASAKPKAFTSSMLDLKYLKIPAVIFVILILAVGLVIPVSILVYWFIASFKVPSSASIWSTSWAELFKSGFNSFSVSAVVATIAVCMSLPLAYWTVRKPDSRTAKLMTWLAQSGLALPGVLIALGLSLVFAQVAPKLNFSVFALILAFLIHFFAQSFQMMRAGIAQLSSRLEESSRVLGYSSLKTFWNVSRPLLKPALMSAWILVFLSSMRELPASLLLRPAGFDPLTVKVWIAASEGFYEHAAAPSLLLVLLSLPLVFIVNKTHRSYQASE